MPDNDPSVSPRPGTIVEDLIWAAAMANVPADPSVAVPPVGPLLERLTRESSEPTSGKIVAFPRSADPLALAARTKATLSPESQAKIAQLVREMSERNPGNGR